MSAAQPLDYNGRCERYAAQRNWSYDPTRLSIGHLTPRRRRRAISKERHAWPGYSRRHIDMPWDPRHAAYNLPELSDDDGYRPDIEVFDPVPIGGYIYGYDGDLEEHDLGYRVTPGCNCQAVKQWCPAGEPPGALITVREVWEQEP